MPANPNFDDLVTTTLELRTGKLADNATKTTAWLDRARRKGKIMPGGSGRTIVHELEVGLNPNAGWFAGLDMLSTQIFHPMSAAEYDWKQAYVPVVWSGREKLMNRSRSEIINLVTARLDNGEKSLYDLVAQASYSDGTGSGGKQMHGLGLLVVSSPSSGTVGGINRATSTNSFWRNQTETVDFDSAPNMAGSSGTMPTTFLTKMNSLAIKCVRGKDRADLWISDATGYSRYLESLQPLQRISNTDVAGYGFTNLKYYAMGGDADVVLDNGYCPSKTMYALNTDYLFLRPHEDMNFVPMGGERVPVNQDATIRFFGFMGNMTSDNLARQGILTDA